MSRRLKKRHSGGLRCLVLCLAQLVLLGARPARAGRSEHSDGALPGYAEGGPKPGGLLSALLRGAKSGGKGVAAAALTAEHLGEGCPPDDRPEQCPGWARAGECLRNPTFMRSFCKASCRVVPQCFAAVADGLWGGHASAAGTERFATGAAAAAGHYRQHPLRYSGVDAAPNASLTLSSLGVGTYLGPSDDATDEAVTNAVLKSISAGWNVIDTAANYRGGRAETAVGRALRALRVLGDAERDQLFVATKAGYPADGLLERLLAAGEVAPADVAGGVHSMAPPFLAASLRRSLAELGLATVDLLYLHNPAESQLAALGRDAFMSRLRAAFGFCEAARRAGRIRSYGIASWSCFRVPPGNRGHLSLQAVVELATEVGGTDHGFRYIQLPVSAAMPEAWAQPWQEVLQGGVRTRATLVQAAEKLGVGVFGSGPLLEAELLKDAQLARAVAAAPQLAGIDGTAPRLLQLARSSPGLLTSLVGHKAPANVDANTALTDVPPLGEAAARAALQGLHESRQL